VASLDKSEKSSLHIENLEVIAFLAQVSIDENGEINLVRQLTELPLDFFSFSLKCARNDLSISM